MKELTLASEINRLHNAATQSAQNTTQYAWEAGKKLAEAKASVKHGEWLGWIEKNLEFSRFTATRYIKLFSEHPELTCLSAGSRQQIGNDSNVASLQHLNNYSKLLYGTDKPKVVHNTGNEEWFTPPEYVEAARAVLGTIDLDPASCEIANKTIKAKRYYAKDDDGLTKTWKGRIFLNPPYTTGVIDKFVAKVVECDEAIVVVNNCTETRWFQTLASKSSAICFPSGRIKFTPGGMTGSSPLQGQAIVYTGSNIAAFISCFRKFGFCCEVNHG